ncbi:MAG: hypothetical protein IJC84_06655 [Clostridia bacterium]|nr:hypothetical protein [Clostridia bacterium]
MTQKKAAVFVMLGQSNAVGHGVPMEEKDKLLTPMKNVFGLSREKNQSFDHTALFWEGYRSFGMNLAEEQDNTYSVPNLLATLWQKHINEGNALGLPDLYIVQIAIGAQGITEGYMWHPDREKRLIPGKLGTVDISLYPFTCHIFSLLRESFAARGMDFEVMGIHWRGGENDMYAETKREYLEEHLEGLYTRMITDFDALLDTPPFVFHLLACPDRTLDCDPTGYSLKNMLYINSVFELLSHKRENVSAFDVRNCPYFVPGVRGNGIFMEDVVHFTPEVNLWVAEQILKAYAEK